MATHARWTAELPMAEAAPGWDSDHGGDIAAAAAAYGHPAEDWLDLSTGINPFAYPVPEIPADRWRRLPQSDHVADVLDAARVCYGALDGAVAAAPGTEALLQALPDMFPRGRVRVLAPTYGGHGAAWRDGGHAVEAVDDPAALAGADVAVAVNPNNPDGRVLAPGGLLDLARDLAARGGCLIVDEAFADLRPDLSLAPHAGRPGLLVLRSFGKFFGLAGLRLGFALGSQSLIDRLTRRLGPWAVSGPALAVAAAALRDRDWQAATRERLGRAARELDDALAGAGLAPAGGTDLFRLVRTPRAGDLHRLLCERAILTRAFAYRPDWLRIGLPGGPEDAARLGRALAGFNGGAGRART